MPDTETQLRSLVCRHLCVRPADVVPDVSFAEDLAADSLDAIELSMLVEDEFGIDLSDDEAFDAINDRGTFGKLLALVEGKLAGVMV